MMDWWPYLLRGKEFRSPADLVEQRVEQLAEVDGGGAIETESLRELEAAAQRLMEFSANTIPRTGVQHPSANTHSII